MSTWLQCTSRFKNLTEDETLMGQTVVALVRLSEHHPSLVWQSVVTKTEGEADKVPIRAVQGLVLHPLVACRDVTIKLRMKTS